MSIQTGQQVTSAKVTSASASTAGMTAKWSKSTTRKSLAVKLSGSLFNG
ncbi:hypothetical protein KYLE_89 [Pantoea phage Kyle]|uniref:Uncharacterized protein n=1 Tax=Pantoea phage Kyle TaxID=2589665 RepID=A0A514A8V4_9CAUD|nr:hypothetical protein HWC52_gp089 [Pantoea phage Kyle]QDH49685.1 hypothetical protein KYLE_89 [Pantoea phage Kyle]